MAGKVAKAVAKATAPTLKALVDGKHKIDGKVYEFKAGEKFKVNKAHYERMALNPNLEKS